MTDQVDKLCVIWTAPDRETALNMAFMYAKNAKLREWWSEVRLIVWGPSQRILIEDEQLQAEVSAMLEVGVEVWACKACADRYGLADKLAAAGVEVLYTGEPLTVMLKQGWKTITV